MVPATRTTRRVKALVALTATAALLLAACGDDDDDSSGSGPFGGGSASADGGDAPAAGSGGPAAGSEDEVFCDWFTASGPNPDGWDVAEAESIPVPDDIVEAFDALVDGDRSLPLQSEVTRWVTANCF